TAGRWPRRARTKPSASGRWRRAWNCCVSRTSPTSSMAWPSPPTASTSPRPCTTAASASGKHLPIPPTRPDWGESSREKGSGVCSLAESGCRRSPPAMPRRPRFATGGYVYHVLNRAVGRATIFEKSADYAAFEKVLRQAKEWQPLRLLAYCLMPNHWHLLLWPQHDGDLSEFLRWLTVTHTQRWHAQHHTAGTGPLYHGRLKSFPLED